jgi:hypothetical protein
VAARRDRARGPERALDERLCGTVPALRTLPLRVAYLSSELQEADLHDAARALDTVCARAEAAHDGARQVVVVLCALLEQSQGQSAVSWLRSLAALDDVPALRRLLYPPLQVSDGARTAVAESDREAEARVPDYGAGRPLTLGERKALARRPTRRLFDRLLADPHPDVIRLVLGNPSTTEDDVVRLAARRPLSPRLLAEIARHPRWSLRSRVRLAVVLNPHCSGATALPLLGLLTRPELRVVVAGTETAEPIRAAARERLRLKGRRGGPEPGEPGAPSGGA